MRSTPLYRSPTIHNQADRAAAPRLSRLVAPFQGAEWGGAAYTGQCPGFQAFPISGYGCGLGGLAEYDAGWPGIAEGVELRGRARRSPWAFSESIRTCLQPGR
jgi:hypothetical protein